MATMETVVRSRPYSYRFLMLDSAQGSDPLQILAAAVTPVVLVSATAILISGVNARYMAISDRMRTLTHEWRDPACSLPRKAMIKLQMHTFFRRLDLALWATRLLYCAVSCFATMALVISGTGWRRVLAATTLPIFVTGIALMLGAIFLELIELKLSNKTISAEVRDVTTD